MMPDPSHEMGLFVDSRMMYVWTKDKFHYAPLKFDENQEMMYSAATADDEEGATPRVGKTVTDHMTAEDRDGD